MIPLHDDVPSRRFPIVTVTIIAINALVFIYQLTLSPAELRQFVFEYGVIPARFTGPGGFFGELAQGGWVPLLTSMFMHGGWLHLISNMWYLWIFGDNIEDLMGYGRFIAFYLITGFIASLAHMYLNMDSQIPSIGASGAIAGVLGGYLLMFPHARVLTLVPIFFILQVIRIPALILLGFWFLIQFLSGAAAVVDARQAAGVAWWAHIGGFLAGLALVKLFAQHRAGYRPRWG
jgi:membrane associated rhomboid family serine protease